VYTPDGRVRLTDAMSSRTGPDAGRQVVVSDELMAPVSTEIELCYQTYGDPAAEPVLLIMGLGGPMTWWDPDFCTLLAGHGFHVIRYDNRDTGRSSRAEGRVTRTALLRAFAGRGARAPYSLGDMAGDAFALLDHLGIDSAHVVGVSMGGMIAQTMAVDRPQRLRSLTSIMSTTGKRSVGWQNPTLLPALLTGRGPSREDYVRTSTTFWKMIGSPSYPQTEARMVARSEETFDRGVSRAGIMRQMLAVLTQTNRAPRLRGLSVPTLVIHGLADKMVHPSGGRATAAAIPGAELILIDGMGHDIPPALFPTIADAIARLAHRARK
jgi:pimeloyl-ACP methyl ester carboxylesterase